MPVFSIRYKLCPLAWLTLVQGNKSKIYVWLMLMTFIQLTKYFLLCVNRVEASWRPHMPVYQNWSESFWFYLYFHFRLFRKRQWIWGWKETSRKRQQNIEVGMVLKDTRGNYIVFEMGEWELRVSLVDFWWFCGVYMCACVVYVILLSQYSTEIYQNTEFFRQYMEIV